MKIAIIIVLYQKKINSSIAFQSVVNQNVDVIFFDNSISRDIVEFNKKYAKENSIKYYTLNGNVGLAKAYNYVIRTEKYDFYITSDDDTKYPSNYIDTFVKEYNQDILVYFPKIEGVDGKKYEKKIYSSKFIIRDIPFKLKLKDKGYYIFINSGAIYSCKVFEKVSFNERLLVEYIDHDMCDKLKYNKIQQKELAITLIQDFSTFLERSDKKTGRLYYTYKDMLTYYGFFAYFYELAKHTIIALKFRKLHVFTLYWKLYIFKYDKNKNTNK